MAKRLLLVMQKDLRLALDLGRETAVPLPGTALAHQMLTPHGGFGARSTTSPWCSTFSRG
jgi:3-hydroxyisobutyrate dehydrogenase-like beta-hydroxyacid dehydrogenase